MEKNLIQGPRLTSTPQAGRNTLNLLNNFSEVSPIFPNHSDINKKSKSLIPVLKTNEARANAVRRCTVSNTKVSTPINGSGHASSGSGKVPSHNKKSVAEKKDILQSSSGSRKIPFQIQKPEAEKKDIKNVQGTQQSSKKTLFQNINKQSELKNSEKDAPITPNGKPIDDCILKKSDKLLGGWLIPKETKNRVSLKRKSSVPLTVSKRNKITMTNSQQSEESLFESPELPNLVEVSSLRKKRQTYVLKKKPEMNDIEEEQQESVTDGIIPLQILSQDSGPNNTSVKNKEKRSIIKQRETKTRKTTKLTEQPGDKSEGKENVEQGNSIPPSHKKKKIQETKTRKSAKLNEQPGAKNEGKENVEQGNSVSPSHKRKQIEETKGRKPRTLNENPEEENKLTEMDEVIENVDHGNSASSTDKNKEETKAKKSIKLSEKPQPEIKSEDTNEGKENYEQENSVCQTDNKKKIQGAKTKKHNTFTDQPESKIKSKEINEEKENHGQDNSVSLTGKVCNKNKQLTKQPHTHSKESANIESASFVNGVAVETKRIMPKRGRKANMKYEDESLEEAVNIGNKTSKKTKTSKSKKNIQMEEDALSVDKPSNQDKCTEKSNKAKPKNKRTIKVKAKSEIPAKNIEEPAVLTNNLEKESSQQNEHCHDILQSSTVNVAVMSTLNTKKVASQVENVANQVNEADLENHKSGKDNLKPTLHAARVISKKSNNNKRVSRIKNRRKNSTQEETENQSLEQRSGKVTETFVESRIQTISGNSSSKSQSLITTKNTEFSEKIMDEENTLPVANKSIILTKDEMENYESSAEKKRKQEHVDCGASRSGPEATSKKPRREEFNSEKVSDTGRPYNIRDLFPMDKSCMKEVQPGVMSYSSIHIHNFLMSGEVHIEPKATLTKISTNTTYRVLEGTAQVKISKQTKIISGTDKHPRFFIPKGIDVSITNVEDVSLKMEFTKFRG